MKILFMGTPEISATALKGLVDGGHNVVAVVTGEDKMRSRGKLTPTDAMYIDIGAKDAEEAKGYADIGDYAVFAPSPSAFGSSAERLIRGYSHLTTKSVNLAHEVSFCRSANTWIARKIAYIIQSNGEYKRLTSRSCKREGGFNSRVSRSYDDGIVIKILFV